MAPSLSQVCCVTLTISNDTENEIVAVINKKAEFTECLSSKVGCVTMAVSNETENEINAPMNHQAEFAKNVSFTDVQKEEDNQKVCLRKRKRLYRKRSWDFVANDVNVEEGVSRTQLEHREDFVPSERECDERSERITCVENDDYREPRETDVQRKVRRAVRKVRVILANIALANDEMTPTEEDKENDEPGCMSIADHSTFAEDASAQQPTKKRKCVVWADDRESSELCTISYFDCDPTERTLDVHECCHATDAISSDIKYNDTLEISR